MLTWVSGLVVGHHRGGRCRK